MQPDVSGIAKAIRARAHNLRRLIGNDGDSRVTSVIQRSYGGLLACAESVEAVDRESQAYIERKTASAMGTHDPNIVRGAILSIQIDRVGYRILMSAAELFSAGQDAAVVELLVKHIGKLFVQIILRVSGGDYVKMAAEALEALDEVLKTKDEVKLRQQQAHLASELFE
jgi:hypothetical protein